MFRLVVPTAWKFVSCLLGSIVLTSFAFASSVVAAPDPDAKQPNIIFILCDDLGWGDLGVFYQNESSHAKKHKTPNLDAMARDGMQLRAHYCPAPVCAPSRASLLTGVHQGHAEVRDNQFDKMLANNHTLATVLKTAGYSTALIGKYGLHGLGADPESWTSFPTKRGFDEFYGYVSHYDGHIHYPADEWRLGDSEGHRTPKKLWHNDQEVSAELQGCYTTDLFTARSKHWIQQQVEREPSKPFFLYLAYDTPHAALQIPSQAYPTGQGLDRGLQWNGKPGAMINTASGEIDSYRHPDYVNRGWTDQEERFATMVRRIDDCVGDLLQTLRDLEIADETLVVLTSDNGPHHESYLKGVSYEPTSFQSYGPFDGTKRDTWEGGIRMPTLAWWPSRIPANSIDNEASQFHDWMATFCDLAGVSIPARCDGVSLLPSLTKSGPRSKSTIYVEYWQNGTTKPYADFESQKQRAKRGQMQVIHLDGYKGIRTDITSHETPFKIYDLNADPKESVDLAEQGGTFAKLQQRMKDRVLQIRVPNASATRPYDEESIPAVAVPSLEPGLIWQAYSGDFPYTPNLQRHCLRQAELLGEGVTDDVAAIELPAGTEVVEFTGYVRIRRTDRYSFVLKTSRGAFLRIHDAAIVDADFGYNAGEERSGSVRLSVGLHPIKLTCLVAPENQTLDLDFRMAASGVAPRPIPASQLSHSMQ